MTKKNMLIIAGIFSLCALTLFAVFVLPAWAGILAVLILGVSGVLTFVLKKNERLQNERSFEIVTKESHVNDLAVYLQRIRENEKAALSRELHDDLGQLLTALRMDIAWLDRGISADKPQMRRKIDDMIQVIERSIRIVQKICTDLHPSILEDLGLVAAIQWQAKDFEKYSRVPVTLDIYKEDIPMEAEEATIFFRIFQEAMINIGRYAKATKVHVTLKEIDQVLTLRIHDNGVGIPAEKIEDPHSFGIAGMRQRILSRGGDLTIKGERNRGTTIEATLKLTKREPAYEDSYRR